MIMKVLSLVSFHTSSLLAYLYNNVLAFGRKEKDCPALKSGDWEEFWNIFRKEVKVSEWASSIFRVEVKATEWAFDTINESFDQVAQDEAGKLSIV